MRSTRRRSQGCSAAAGSTLAAVSDLTACVYVFPCPHDPNAVDVLPRFWCPEAQLTARGRNQHLYRQWHDDGYLDLTPGDACDYAFVKAAVVRDAQHFRLAELAV